MKREPKLQRNVGSAKKIDKTHRINDVAINIKLIGLADAALASKSDVEPLRSSTS